jgi:hypothetical protein
MSQAACRREDVEQEARGHIAQLLVSGGYVCEVARAGQWHGSVGHGHEDETIKVVEQSFAIGESDLVQIERMYPLAQETMRSGLYVPNRNSTCVLPILGLL